MTVRSGRSVELRSEPGGEIIGVLSDTTQFGSPTALSVVERRGNWAGVPSELVPNGRLVWLELDSSSIEIDSVQRSIVIDLSRMRAELLRHDRVEHAWQIGIGTPESPTPTGRFSVTDEIEGGLNPTYGCCALALSATQPNLPAGWSGGNRMAIHGTMLPLGEANSTGCVHSSEEDLHMLLDRVPLGTPVSIRR
ncbi:MAG: L,D-transpeptidase [Solirubrobacterales bacterium]|nr:L,D-transpeptidase [Solirubrobacterales bacterium]